MRRFLSRAYSSRRCRSRLESRVERGVNVPHLSEEGSELQAREFTVHHADLEASGLRLVVKCLRTFLELEVKTSCLGRMMMVMLVSHWEEHSCFSPRI